MYVHLGRIKLIDVLLYRGHHKTLMFTSAKTKKCKQIDRPFKSMGLLHYQTYFTEKNVYNNTANNLQFYVICNNNVF